MPKYPQVVIDLDRDRIDGNAYAILAAVQRKMELARLPSEVFDAFEKEAKSGDYQHLLATLVRWVAVE